MDNSSFRAKTMSRTAGDGMESDDSVPEASSKSVLNSNKSNKTSILPERLVQVYATNIVKTEKRKPHVYSKSPKFVPYEPYPAAVKPIVSQATKKYSKKLSKNNMDINTLISQMSQMDTSIIEYKPRAKLRSLSEKANSDPNEQCVENIEMKTKIDQLVHENESLKEQLKQQAQVNKELKTMLVASMGEDLETQVQSLNQDKKHLADALLNSAKHLSTHQEQTEWLAGQCEVWRSKFLASSLMVEELANWKKVLSQRTEELQQAIKQMFDERCRARDMMLCTYKNLCSLHDKWLKNVMSNTEMFNRPIGNYNSSISVPHTTNILELSSVNLKLSENVSYGMDKQDISLLLSLPHSTEAEMYAENVVSRSVNAGVAKGVECEGPVQALVSHAQRRAAYAPPAACPHCSAQLHVL